jgi:hypothetical protein
MHPKIAEQVAVLRVDHSEDSLLQAYSHLTSLGERGRDGDKLLAEVCFLLALERKKKNDMKGAGKYAEEAVGLYSRLKIQSQEDAIPLLGNLLPDLMHEGVVKAQIYA